MSISGGLPKAVDRAVERGCETMQIFASNPRGWKHSDILPADTAVFRRGCEREEIGPVFVHTIYLINLAAADDEVWKRSLQALDMNIRAAADVGAAAVVTHLGGHGGRGDEFGIKRIVAALEGGFARGGKTVTILLETTAGSGNSVGHDFAQLGRIAGAFAGEDGLGVCFDTCHAFAAGYELRTSTGLEAALDELDREVGLQRLALVHANDSKGDLGSHLDRHEHIGQGKLGRESFALMAAHPALKDLPWILETPGMTVEEDRENLRRLRELAGGR